MKTSLSIRSAAGKSCRAFKNSFLQILWFETLCKALAAIVVVPLFSGIMNITLRMNKRGFVANRDILSFFMSPSGILVGALLLTLSVLFVYIEFSVLITLIYHGYHNEKVKVTQAIKSAFHGTRDLASLQMLGFGAYTLVILPLANMGIVSSVLPDLSIPNFIIASLSETLWGAVLLLFSSLLIMLLGAMLSYALPVFVLEHIPFHQAVAKSGAAMKKTLLKRFFMELLFVAAWVALLMIPVIVLAYMIDVKGFLSPNMLDIFTTFGIAWRSFICLVAAAAIWILQTLFMPMILAIATVTYLELPECLAALPKKPKDAKKTKRVGKGLRRIAVAMTTVFAIIVLSNAINIIGDMLTWPPARLAPVVMGHRGSLAGVENTLEAIQGAIDAGADYAEIDVQLSKDGIPVVVHDTNLSRLSGQKLQVYDLTAEELGALVLEQNGFTGHIPTLDQVIAYSKGKIKLNIELKLHGHETSDLVEKVGEIVEKENYSEYCIFQSISYELAQRMKKANPQYLTGYIIYGNLGSPNALGIRQMGIDFLAAEESFATQRLVIACRKADIPLYVWTVNDPEEMRRFWDLGVDGLITDLPDLARLEMEQSSILWD